MDTERTKTLEKKYEKRDEKETTTRWRKTANNGYMTNKKKRFLT
jgi:hypothetical protein